MLMQLAYYTDVCAINVIDIKCPFVEIISDSNFECLQ